MYSRPIQIPRRADAPGPTPARERHAARPAPVVPRLVRFDHAAVADQFPAEVVLRIDVNGCLAGAVRALPDAPRELGVGWALMHGFIAATDALEHVTAGEGRVSIMVDGGGDPDRLRLEAVGWRDPEETAGTGVVPIASDPLALTEAALTDLVERTFRAFAGDGGAAGYSHAAVAAPGAVQCIARDLRPDLAVAKVLGWALLEGRDLDTRILVVRGIPDEAIVRAAARAGVALVVSDAIPTAGAVRFAARATCSLAGMATSDRIGLFVDAGHVTDGPEAGAASASGA